ncbi:Bug family tripartite tricarboxylate transporter substrate binding protein [Salinadaptatus halalkaliphilus]|nr:tripartite tricarboxylate transporter substrate-binding protein [Salinadaptatus halalkaliphilus]
MGDNGDGEFPSDDITIVIGYPEGSSTDAAARNLAPIVSDITGQNVAVQNLDPQPRAGGEVAGMEPDGHTIFHSYTPSLVTANLVEEPGWTVPDLEPLGRIGIYSTVLAVNPDHGIEDPEDLFGRYQDGEFTQTCGLGVAHPWHIANVFLRDQYGMEWDTFVSYDSGAEQGAGIVGNEVPAGVAGDFTIMDQYESGDVDILCSLASEQTPIVEEQGIETWTDLGYDEMDFITNFNHDYFAPPGTPDDIADQWEEILEEAHDSDEFREHEEETTFMRGWAGRDEVGDNVDLLHNDLPDMIDMDGLEDDV